MTRTLVRSKRIMQQLTASPTQNYVLEQDGRPAP